MRRRGNKNLRVETYQSFAIEKEIEVIYNFVDVSRFNKKPIDAFRKVIAPNGEKIIMHARKDSTHFFEKLGYEVMSEPFIELTIPHVIMGKELSD